MSIVCRQQDVIPDRHRPRYQCFILAYRGMHPSSWFDNYGFLTRNNIRDTSSLQILSHSVIDVNHSQEWRIFLKLNTQQQPMDHFFPCHQQRISFSRERLQFLIRQFNKDILQNSMLSYAIQLTYVDASEPYWGSIIINPVESLESIFFTRFLKQNKGEKPVLTAKSLSLPPVSKDDLRYSSQVIKLSAYNPAINQSTYRSTNGLNDWYFQAHMGMSYNISYGKKSKQITKN